MKKVQPIEDINSQEIEVEITPILVATRICDLTGVRTTTAYSRELEEGFRSYIVLRMASCLPAQSFYLAGKKNKLHIFPNPRADEKFNDEERRLFIWLCNIYELIADSLSYELYNRGLIKNRVLSSMLLPIIENYHKHSNHMFSDNFGPFVYKQPLYTVGVSVPDVPMSLNGPEFHEFLKNLNESIGVLPFPKDLPDASDWNGCVRGFYYRLGNSEINIGLYEPDNGCFGEFSIVWSVLGEQDVPQLRVYDDGWATLIQFNDVLVELAKYDNMCLTPLMVRDILLKCGLQDMTDKPVLSVLRDFMDRVTQPKVDLLKHHPKGYGKYFEMYLNKYIDEDEIKSYWYSCRVPFYIVFNNEQYLCLTDVGEDIGLPMKDKIIEYLNMDTLTLKDCCEYLGIDITKAAIHIFSFAEGEVKIGQYNAMDIIKVWSHHSMVEEVSVKDITEHKLQKTPAEIYEEHKHENFKASSNLERTQDTELNRAFIPNQFIKLDGTILKGEEYIKACAEHTIKPVGSYIETPNGIVTVRDSANKEKEKIASDVPAVENNPNGKEEVQKDGIRKRNLQLAKSVLAELESMDAIGEDTLGIDILPSFCGNLPPRIKKFLRNLVYTEMDRGLKDGLRLPQHTNSMRECLSYYAYNMAEDLHEIVGGLTTIYKQLQSGEITGEQLQELADKFFNGEKGKAVKSHKSKKPVKQFRGKLAGFNIDKGGRLSMITENISKENKIFVLSIDELPKAEAIYPGAIDLIGPWLEAIHTGNVNEFYDGLADIDVPSIQVPSNVNLRVGERDDEVETLSYDELCDLSKSAIDAMFKSLLLSYNIHCIKEMMQNFEVVSCHKLDSVTVVLTMCPRMALPSFQERYEKWRDGDERSPLFNRELIKPFSEQQIGRGLREPQNLGMGRYYADALDVLPSLTAQTVLHSLVNSFPLFKS